MTKSGKAGGQLLSPEGVATPAPKIPDSVNICPIVAIGAS